MPKPGETPEERLERMGVHEDPGPDPDPVKIWIRFGRQYRIEKYDISRAQFDQKPGWARPFGWVNIAREIYQQDAKSLWVWEPLPEPIASEPVPEAAVRQPRERSFVPLTPEQVKSLMDSKKDFVEIPFRTTTETVEFTESSKGLPTEGSWRNSLDVADMNEDGFLDIIAPPQRGPDTGPSIFLGDGKGNWRRWRISFPNTFSYGSVAAGDLNRDGHVDLVFGVHLCCVLAYLGDGKGTFTESSEGLSSEFSSRRVIIRDVNGDKYPDIIANSEGPTMQQKNPSPARMKVFLNQKGKSWTDVTVADRSMYVGGDWLAAGDFNRDGKIDLVGSSIYFGGTDLFYLNSSPQKWRSFGRDWLPLYSSYTALTAGKFSSKKADDAILTIFRQWPSVADPMDVPPPDVQTVIGLERVSWKDGKPSRTPIARWGSKVGVWGISNGDFNRDGNQDIVFVQAESRQLVILLGDGEGNFRKAVTAGVTVRPNVTYDVKVADVNKDGAADVILMYESNENVSVKDGSIQVFLNRKGT